MKPATVFFFTDFGSQGPYLGLMEAALLRHCPHVRIIHLLCDAPAFSPRPAAYLLGALVPWMEPGAVLLGVVDPGVGTDREALLIEAEGCRFIGPDNGLFAALFRRPGVRAWKILWRPARLSSTFHGRDLFAPAAGRLLSGRTLEREAVAPGELVGAQWPDQLAEIIYIDHYGNAMSGLRAATVEPQTAFRLGDVVIRRGRTFADVPPGEPFWYENSLGLVEIAVNRGRCDRQLGVSVGMPLLVA